MKCHFSFSVFSFFMIFHTATYGEEKPKSLQTARVGQTAPAIVLDQILQAPKGTRTDWASLRGKVVVVEFWSTGCSPCLQWSPFVNKLEEAFEKKPVVFISITDEDEATVQRCLKKFPIHGWIGIDRDRSIHDAYGIYSLPTMALVGLDGKLLGWTSPSTLTGHPEMLDAAIAGKMPDQMQSSPRSESPYIDRFRDVDSIASSEKSSTKKKLPLCSILIRESEEGEKKPHNGLADARNSFIESVTMLKALASAYKTTAPYIISDTPLPESPKYDILFRWNKGRMSVGNRLLQEALKATFSVEVRREKRMMDVYVLGYPEGHKPRWELSRPSLKYDRETGLTAPTAEVLKRKIAGEKFFTSLSGVSELTLHLSYAFGKPVVNDTEIDGLYNFYFPYDRDHDDTQVIIKSMRDKYGLTLTLAKREIEVLAVYQADGEMSSTNR